MDFCMLLFQNSPWTLTHKPPQTLRSKCFSWQTFVFFFLCHYKHLKQMGLALWVYSVRDWIIVLWCIRIKKYFDVLLFNIMCITCDLWMLANDTDACVYLLLFIWCNMCTHASHISVQDMQSFHYHVHEIMFLYCKVNITIVDTISQPHCNVSLFLMVCE